MRSIEDAIRGLNPPLAPKCNSLGRVLADMDNHQCRFPLSGTGEATRFCAVEISPGDWKPGEAGGCYCRTHRLVTRQAREAA
jgi:hypothetical protein